METQSYVFNILAMKEAENKYREILRHEPGDMKARIDLAWSLFVQALHQAGQDAIPGAGGRPAAESAEQTSDPEGHPTGNRADVLINDCLTQTYMVMQLSSQFEDRLNATRLQELVKLICGEAPLQAAEAKVLQLLSQLTWAVQHSAEAT